MAAHVEIPPEHLLAFAQRSRSEVEAHKRDDWVQRVREHGASEGLRAADALREHAEAFALEPAAERRAADLDALIALKKRIDAASSRFRR